MYEGFFRAFKVPNPVVEIMKMSEMLIVEVIKHDSPCLPYLGVIRKLQRVEDCAIKTKLTTDRSIRSEVFCKKGVPEKSRKIHRKTTLPESLLKSRAFSL